MAADSQSPAAVRRSGAASSHATRTASRPCGISWAVALQRGKLTARTAHRTAGIGPRLRWRRIVIDDAKRELDYFSAGAPSNHKVSFFAREPVTIARMTSEKTFITLRLKAETQRLVLNPEAISELLYCAQDVVANPRADGTRSTKGKHEG